MLKVTKYLLILVVSGVLLACSSKPPMETDALLQAKTNLFAENYSLAAQQLQPLAQAGSADAQYALGYLYYYGKGVPQDETIARDWIRKAAEQDHASA